MKANASPCLPLSRDSQGAWNLPHWECQGHLAWLQFCGKNMVSQLGHAPRGLHSLGMAAPFMGCSLAVRVTWAFLLHLLQHAEAKKGQRKSIKKENLFWGKKSVFLGLHQKEPLFTPPQGQVTGSLWLGRTSCSFASDWAGPRGCAKEESCERQDWEAKIRWERDWQLYQMMMELGSVPVFPS